MHHREIVEYNVIGSAIRLDELPPQIRKMKLLGRGATTLAFEKDDQTVVLFTRDAMKSDWLRHGLHLVTDESVIEPVKNSHIKGMNDIPISVLTLPKLYPLSKENKRIVIQEIKNWIDISNDAKQHAATRSGNSIGNYTNKHKFFNNLLRTYEDKYPDSILSPLFGFLANYDPDQYHFDIGNRQFMQTLDGKIVLLDPIVSEELMKLFNDHRMRR